MTWSVITNADTLEKHVLPDFGKKHELTLDCWCQPRRDDNVDMVIIHWSHEPVAVLAAAPLAPSEEVE